MKPFQRLLWKDGVGFKDIQKQISNELSPDNKSFEELKKEFRLDMPDLSCVTYFDDPYLPIYAITAFVHYKEMDSFNEYLFEKVDKILNKLLPRPA